ncbi:unnamed protein product [Trichogramma brassicae]|uniref:Reverse transcriptase domain-containing protein n=1 Tax=Trichogramma brassicae TaxID=86971 RepID=A0A6H5HZQ6_9HYME|nr:unnamed protein product [Trichogramma brassicae]
MLLTSGNLHCNNGVMATGLVCRSTAVLPITPQSGNSYHPNSYAEAYPAFFHILESLKVYFLCNKVRFIRLLSFIRTYWRWVDVSTIRSRISNNFFLFSSCRHGLQDLRKAIKSKPPKGCVDRVISRHSLLCLFELQQSTSAGTFKWCTASFKVQCSLSNSSFPSRSPVHSCTKKYHNRARMDRAHYHERYKEARPVLRRAIKTSKRQCWKDLVQSVDDCPWGRPYKIVINKLRNQATPSPTDLPLVTQIVRTLFPSDAIGPGLLRIEGRENPQHVPPVTMEELRRAMNRIRDVAAPGPNGVPNKVLKLAMQTRLELFLGVKIVGYTDGIAIVVTAKHLEDVTLKANRAIRIVRDRLQINGLQLADHKTEAVLVTSRKQTECIELCSEDCTIMSAPSLRYLGVHIDSMSI